MTFKIYERTDKVSKKGSPLTFIIHPGGKKINTGYYCKKGSWNQESQSVKATGADKDPMAPQINAKLRRASIALQDFIDKGHSINQIRKEYQAYLKPTEAPVLGDVPLTNATRYAKLTNMGKEFHREVDRILNNHKSDWSDTYKVSFQTVRSLILNYDSDFEITKLNEDWWRDFVNWCIEERGVISNTVATYSNTIKTLAEESGIKLDISWSTQDTDIMGLDWAKVLLIRDSDISEYRKPSGEDSRKLWLASAFTGRRWSEVLTISPSNFYTRDGKLRYKNIGKRNKQIDIPLLPEAEQFFKSIDFRLPKYNNSTVNTDIKQICKLLGFKEEILILKPISPSKVRREVKEEWETVHFHTARHSYCLKIVEMLSGEPGCETTAAWLMGHTGPATTWRYMNRVASSHESLFDRVISIRGIDKKP